MSVQGARVQIVVKGDDVTLRHQIVSKAALLAHEVLAPVTVDTGDITKVFYPYQDGYSDQIGYLAAPVGPLPSSLLDVPVAGSIPAVIGVSPERGTKAWLSGPGLTARVEITRIATGKKETYYLIDELDVFERGFAATQDDTTGGVNPPEPPLILP